MLDQFQIPPEHAVRVNPTALRNTVEAIFEALGMTRADAEQSADVLMYADLRGIDTHGLSNMLRRYVEQMRGGELNLSPEFRVLQESQAACTIDSDGAHGGVVGPHAMRLAMARAREFGVGVVNVYNGGHYGAAAYTAAMALTEDMVGISMCTGGLMMTPTFAAEMLVGLNPIAIAAPAGEEAPFIFDASMSGVAGNKVRIMQRLARGTLPGWLADSEGRPIMEPREVPNDFMHLPLGGTRELGSHKGFGLALGIEILTSVLAGAAGGPDRRARQCLQLMALRVDAFHDIESFKRDMDAYLRRIREAKTAPGHERVYYAGLMEHETERERLARGIPLHREVMQWLGGVVKELGLPEQPLEMPVGVGPS